MVHMHGGPKSYLTDNKVIDDDDEGWAYVE